MVIPILRLIKLLVVKMHSLEEKARKLLGTHIFLLQLQLLLYSGKYLDIY